MAKAKKRLSKKPTPVDYVVEEVFGNGERTSVHYRELRADARELARQSAAGRVRVFRIKYVLVSDKKR